MEVVQLLKDFLGVNEGLGGDAFVDMRYRALNCTIEEGYKKDVQNITKLVSEGLTVCFRGRRRKKKITN